MQDLLPVKAVRWYNTKTKGHPSSWNLCQQAIKPVLLRNMASVVWEKGTSHNCRLPLKRLLVGSVLLLHVERSLTRLTTPSATPRQETGLGSVGRLPLLSCTSARSSTFARQLITSGRQLMFVVIEKLLRHITTSTTTPVANYSVDRRRRCNLRQPASPQKQC